MNSSNYTLDRFEGDYAVFLKRPAETEQLLIHRSEMTANVKEGDIVQLFDTGQKYEITVLKNETNSKKTEIQNLMNKLKK